MGQQLSYIAESDLNFDPKPHEFFSTIRSDSLLNFIQQTKLLPTLQLPSHSPGISDDLLLNSATNVVEGHGNSREVVLNWKKYFQLFTEIKQRNTLNSEAEKRSAWHPATFQYAMELDDNEEIAYRVVARVKSGEGSEAQLPDDYTDDGIDEEEEDDEDISTNNNKKSKSRRLSAEEYEQQLSEVEAKEIEYEEFRPQWNASLVNPIFFGYMTTSLAQLSNVQGEADSDVTQAENRALGRAKLAKIDAKDGLEKKSLIDATSRVKKIDELKKKYEAATQRRVEEYTRSEVALNPTAFRLYLMEWTREKKEAEKAYELELNRMLNAHEMQICDDQVELRRIMAEAALFEDSIGLERPTASLIEDIAKAELIKWTQELQRRCQELEVIRDEYTNLRNSLVGRRGAKDSKVIDERSMAVVSLTRLKESQKLVEEGILCLNDSELLLKRAMRLSTQEAELLAVFKTMAGMDNDYPKTSPFNLLIAGIILIMSATFDQRVDAFFKVFSPADPLMLSREYLIDTVTLLVEAMYRLKLLPFHIPREEMMSLVMRAFMELNLKPSASLTQFEAKNFLHSLICRNRFFSDLLGVDRSNIFSAYQRQVMNPLTLLTYGVIDITACKHILHFQMTRYQPKLHPTMKMKIHDYAMNQGIDDPLRVNYRQLIEKSGQRSSSYIEVVPLKHGHLMNIAYVEAADRNTAAIKIQSIFRSFKERRFAELAAKQQAFFEAKAIAVQEMKDALVLEFRTREASTGMGRMKWDAQVRLKQGKLRGGGQSVSRSDTIMIMMEEAMQRATDEIDARFKEIQSKEEFADFTIDIKDLVIDDPSKRKDIAELFGLSHWFEDPEVEEQEREIVTPRPEDIDDDREEQASHGNKLELSNKRITEALEGHYELEELETSKGANKLERDLRRAMAFPSPETLHIISRLRAIDSVFTLLKVTKFLTELPSKRLLVKLVEAMSVDQLASELQEHFKLTRNHQHIAKVLKAIAGSDLEAGVLSFEVDLLQKQTEKALQAFLHNNLTVLVTEYNRRVESRLRSSAEEVDEESVVGDEVARNAALVTKYNHECSELSTEMVKLRQHHKAAFTSLCEVERRRHALTNLERFRAGSDLVVVVTDDERKLWMQRMSNARLLPESNNIEKQIKFAEISSVCKEFIDVATADAITIINEYYQPNMKKSILIYEEVDIDGRSNVSGRGISGKKHMFEAHNILYRVCLDDDGVFNGSDEYAAKAGGNERLFSLQYSRCHLPTLHVPLIVTVDYFGFRVLAISQLPTTKIFFNEKGEVRKSTEDFVHGVSSRGDFFVNKNRLLQTLLEETSKKLNLGEHNCKGFRDISGSKTFCSAEIKIFKAEDGHFYMRDFWTAFPPELPEVTVHLSRTPRDQSIYWRRLRPELCATHPTTLSPDAASTIVYHTLDQLEQYDNVLTANRRIVDNLVFQFIEYTVGRTYLVPLSEGLGLDIAHELHVRGLNIRHLGLIRSLLWRPVIGTVSLHNNEKFLRTSNDVRNEVRNGDKISVLEEIYSVTETVKYKISFDRIPIDRKYLGRPIRGVHAKCGYIVNESNSHGLRCLFLAEMVARTIKNVMKAYMRNYMHRSKGTSITFMFNLISEFFNVVTGASNSSSRILSDIIFEGIRERFGSCAVAPSERNNLQITLAPCIPYVITRLVAMLDIKVNILCMVEFHQRPLGFSFCPADFNKANPVVRHNVALLPYAEAVQAVIKADEAEKNTFREQVMSDKPLVFYLLYERKGSRSAGNLGLLGPAFEGIYAKGCEQYLPGPISGDSFSKSVGFGSERKGFISVKFHERLIPQDALTHFSCEVFAKCLPCKELKRVVLTCGRFIIFASRENYWVFGYKVGIHEVKIRIAPCVMNKFQHIVCTFDGTTVRCYIDSYLEASVEVETAVIHKAQALRRKLADQHAAIESQEREDKAHMKEETIREADEYLNTKDGILYLNSTAAAVMETAEFIKEHLDIMSDKKATPAHLKKEASAIAKHKYTTDLYVHKVQEVTEKYQKLRDELKQRIHWDEDNNILSMRRPLIIGADEDPKEKSGTVSNGFIGHISCVSVYSSCLSSDRVRIHCVSASFDKTLDASRMYGVASIKFEEALRYITDFDVIKGYAQSLCGYLKMECSPSSTAALTQGRNKVLTVIQELKHRHNTEGIAEILKSIPHQGEFADIVCVAFGSIIGIDPNFFIGDKNMTRADLVHLPRVFLLDELHNPPEMLQTAAAMYREVVQDPRFEYCYGETQLKWIAGLISPELVIAIVQHAVEELNLNFVVVGKLFNQATNEKVTILDADIQILAQNLPLAVGFDLSGCVYMTKISLQQIVRNRAVVALNLDGCIDLDDDSLLVLKTICKQLELLSLARLKRLTDNGVIPLVTACNRLTVLNLNNCSQLTQNTLFYAAQSNKQLATLHCSSVFLNNEGLLSLCQLLSPDELTSIDISFCRDLTDYSIIAFANTFHNLTFINMCGLSRLTGKGARAICENNWKLTSLNLEDLFLLSDTTFLFSQVDDVRRDLNMLKSLQIINLRDCVNLTDIGLQGIIERCRSLRELYLRGCDKLSDKSLSNMILPYKHTTALSQHLLTLDVSFCRLMTATGILTVTSHCSGLEELNVSGIATVNDKFLKELVDKCPSITRLIMQRCLLVTDAGLCQLSASLWLQTLDASFCTKITDEGIEVLTLACSGLNHLCLKKLSKLSDKCLKVIHDNSRLLRTLDVTDIGSFTPLIIETLRKKGIRIYA